MAEAAQVIRPRRGEVYLVSLDPTVGAAIKKSRPAVVVQNDPANRRSPITLVAAVTSQFEEPLYPTEVPVRAPEGGAFGGLRGASEPDPLGGQAPARRRLGVLKTGTMKEVDRALLLSLGLVEL